jgi:DNA-binding MarR family transcriptional regulator
MRRPAKAEAQGDDAHALLAALRALVRRFSVSERADVACCGVTVAQAAALETLLAEGPLRLGSLGRRLGITPSTLTRNVARLETAGLVQREGDAVDARSSRVGLTPAGRAAAEALERQELAFARRVLERLPEGRRAALRTAFHDLLPAVREATEECCPGAFEHLMPACPAAPRPRSRRRTPSPGEVERTRIDRPVPKASGLRGAREGGCGEDC